MLVVENRPGDTDDIDADEKEERARRGRDKGKRKGKGSFHGERVHCWGPGLGLDWTGNWVGSRHVCVALRASDSNRGEECAVGIKKSVKSSASCFCHPCQQIHRVYCAGL